MHQVVQFYFNQYRAHYRSSQIQLMFSISLLFDSNLSLFYISQVSRHFLKFYFPREVMLKRCAALPEICFM